jgi:hypothetical protein
VHIHLDSQGVCVAQEGAAQQVVAGNELIEAPATQPRRCKSEHRHTHECQQRASKHSATAWAGSPQRHPPQKSAPVRVGGCEVVLGVFHQRLAVGAQQGKQEGAAARGEDARRVSHSLEEEAHVVSVAVAGLQQQPPGVAAAVAGKGAARASVCSESERSCATGEEPYHRESMGLTTKSHTARPSVAHQAQSAAVCTSLRFWVSWRVEKPGNTTVKRSSASGVSPPPPAGEALSGGAPALRVPSSNSIMLAEDKTGHTPQSQLVCVCICRRGEGASHAFVRVQENELLRSVT